MERRNAWRLLAAGAALLSSVAFGAGPGALAASGGPVDVAAEVGLGDIATRPWTANAADHDGDGDQDWLLVRHNPQWFWFGTEPEPVATLFRNDIDPVSGTRSFAAVDELFPAPRASEVDRHDCDFADVDLNSTLDLFCAIGLDDESTNELWTQDLLGGFQDSSASFGLSTPAGGNYRTTTFIHANDDLYPDVYVTRYYGADGPPLNDPAEEPPQPNELWLNEGGSSFRRAPEFQLDRPIGAQKDTPGCTQAVDYDGDRDDDLLVCGYKAMKLYRNNGDDTFTDVTSTAIGGFWKDARIDHFGGTADLDLVQLKAGSLVVRLRNATGGWNKRYTNSLSAGETLATGDFDGDSDTDVYVVRTCASGVNQPDLVYLNDGTGILSRTTVPGTPGGCGNDVEAIDYDVDGRTDFIVLNGKQKKPGPVQLFTWR